MTKREEDLYPEIENWLNRYLKEKYKGYLVETTHKTSRLSLDVCLKNIGLCVNDAIGLSIKIDIVGILKRDSVIKLVFIEVKDQPLTLKDLCQLWGYSQLLNPAESFLISSKGLGNLNCLFKILKREDLLLYGVKKDKMMRVCKWDEHRKSIDYSTLIPKI
jgi:hypothetical protein